MRAMKTLPSETLINYLEDYKLSHDMTQKELLEKIGMSRQQYSATRLSKTNVHLKTVTRIAVALGVPVSDILGIEDEPNKDFPVEIREWLRTDHGREWIMRGYANYKEKEAKRFMDEMRADLTRVSEKVLN